MLLPPEVYARQKNAVPKAYSLALLAVNKFRVPPFVVVTDLQVETDVELVVKEITAVLPGPLFAVRFAALSEDSVSNSHAGRYETKLAVPASDITDAIHFVVQKSRKKLKSGEPFAVIVQEYIDADVSGVAFTRHPESTTSMRIECAEGAGSVVGGEKARVVDITSESSLNKLPNYLKELVSVMKQVEKLFGFPQDVEWCCRDGILYLLQSRPITTLSKVEWEAALCIDAVTAGADYYHYTTAVIGESYKEAKPLNYSLVCELYKKDGAVDRAYQRLAVNYQSTEHILQIGNQVFIDKDKEVRTLLPAYRLQAGGTHKISYLPIRELLISAKNKVLLDKKPSPELVCQVVRELFAFLKAPSVAPATLTESLQKLLQDFEIIFLINYFAQKNIKADEAGVFNALYIEGKNIFKAGHPNLLSGITVGNSLSLDDVSTFVYPSRDDAASGEISFADMLRELGRWHSVCLAGAVRAALISDRNSTVCHNSDLVYYATYLELLSDACDVSALEARREMFEKQKQLKFPNEIRSYKELQKTSHLMLSEGEVTGLLVTADELSVGSKQSILYVETLTPGLVERFADVAGIVVAQGGMLSHAAIVAREQGLPVLKTTEDIEPYLRRLVRLSSKGLEIVS